MTHETTEPTHRLDEDALWAAIDDQRSRTADLLASLTPEQWQHPSLCDGWTVRDVGAHLTLQQQRIRDIAALVARNPQLLRSVGLNRTIHDSAVIQARLPTDEIVGRIRAMIGSRKHNSFVSRFETLTDILVHGQDIAIPLGADLEMLTPATAVAASRVWDTRAAWFSSVFKRLPLDGYRLTATDTDWARGQGPEVSGPIGAILLLMTGRAVALERLAGPGAERLRAGPGPA
jgi:uncharacterized protein (TIGR03083 family)